MNIVMLCESAELSGGAERVAISEALELRKRGYRVGYIAAGSHSDPILEKAGVEVLLIDTKSFFETQGAKNKLERMFYNSKVVEPITTFLKGFSVAETIVHAHTFRLKLSGKAVEVAQALRFATVVHCHDYSPVCPTSLYFNHRTQTPCELKPLSLSCVLCECQSEPLKYKLPKVTSAFVNTSLFRIYQQASLLIHVSNQEQGITGKFLKGKSNVLISPPHSISRTERTVVEKNVQFVYIGRLTPEKNPHSFLSSCREAAVQAVVIGDGRLKESLAAEFPEAIFLGWLDDYGLENALSEVRCLVVPSRWKETYGLSVVDCMSRGIPCIVSDNVGAKEWIADQVDGVVYDGTDGKNLVEAIRRYKQDSLLTVHSEAAYNKIWSNPPTIERHVDELEAEYKLLLSKEVK